MSVLAAVLTVITIDAGANRHPISPQIYGVAFATAQQLDELNAPLNRRGGNATTRYNWLENATNHASDWYFESLPEISPTMGADADELVDASRAGGAAPMIAVGMIGWVARLGNHRQQLASFSIAKYGAQTDHDWQWFPDAGNGMRASGKPVTGNDPNDANLPADSFFQQAWVAHLGDEGVRWFLLDNEPSIWHETHRDVHPAGATMDEIRDRSLDYANRIKDAVPDAIVCGPEEWGWSGFLLSGYDQQYGAAHGWSSFPDRIAHGNADFIPWYLGEMKRAGASRRLLDVLTVHWYPQSGEFSDDVSPRMQALRNRSTRALWDRNYVDESWIDDRVYLIPRLRDWVSATYPGTRIGITEYNWGAERDMNGATAQADVLGIFGREGLDVANRWTTPDRGTPVYEAMRMYRNYDGNQSAFGDISVSASAPDPDHLSAFAAERSSDHTLTVMIVAKDAGGSVRVDVRGFPTGAPAEVWQLANGTITRLPDTASLTINVPAPSVTLLVIRPGVRRRATR
jgi:Glycoside hydrolase family 44